MLKKIWFPLLFLALPFGGRAQQDPVLLARIDSMLQLTETSQVNRMLDFTYPKIFTIAPREQLAEVLANNLNTEEYSSTLDSVKLMKLFPIFTIGDGQYAKLSHSMLMRMKFKEPVTDEQLAEGMAGMAEIFGKGNFRFDKPNNSFVISMTSYLVAIKDSYSKEWTFLNYRDDDPTIQLLLNDEVVNKLKEYK